MKALACALMLLAMSGVALADEGMWTFDHFPKELVREKLGVEVTDQWLDKVRLATTRLESGCTGSFVSPDGLLLTNHHCARECLAQLSTPERDLLEKGFLAKSRAEEWRCPTQQVSVLMATEEITSKVAAATRGMEDKAANEARKKELSRLEQVCQDASKSDTRTGPLLCQSVTLYQGGQYFLYKYRRYEDVRLVFAPEFGIAAFGGDPDNFQFPRWCLDMSLLRVYENDKPVRSPSYLKVNFAGPQEREPVFVSGHPGSTDRLLTVEELISQRNAYLPVWLLRYAELRGRYIQFGKGDAESQRIVEDPLNRIENSIKVRRKELDALLDDTMMASKRGQEQELRARVAADPALRNLAGSAWDDMARAQVAYRNQLVPYTFVEGSAGFNSSLYRYAFSLVRAAAERAKPNEERLREYTNASLPLLEQQVRAAAPVYPSLEKVTLSYSLERMREWLGPDDRLVREVLGSESPDSLASKLIEGTQLADPKVREALWNGGTAAVEASNDPMIRLARRVDADARVIRKRFEDEVEAPSDRASERIAAARFKALGTSIYPDATFTLRLNFGTVQGWKEKGEPVVPFTTLKVAFDRATGKDPFRIPDTWVQAKPTLALDTRFNLATNNDIVGGNSGSPLINAKGELVGLMFDGNIHSISGSYWFDPDQNRAIAVHPAIMREGLTKVYRADALMREISAR
ncbi:MAG TPA: S46 family peptidase [Steroidobacteraceae bacterium]|nr:S46 family peptidase [Steroidobacteraceae bacterium]